MSEQGQLATLCSRHHDAHQHRCATDGRFDAAFDYGKARLGRATTNLPSCMIFAVPYPSPLAVSPASTTESTKGEPCERPSQTAWVALTPVLREAATDRADSPATLADNEYIVRHPVSTARCFSSRRKRTVKPTRHCLPRWEREGDRVTGR